MTKAEPQHSRRETSAESLERKIRADCLRFTFSRSGGPGGQNVNKVSTRVDLAFDLDRSFFSEHEKNRIRQFLARRIHSDGMIHVISSKHRTQSANRSAAIQRLHELLAHALKPHKKRHATKPTRGSQERRLRVKKKAGEKKSLRRTLIE